jgi:hypothetical protein
MSGTALVFGSGGALGSAIATTLSGSGWSLITAGTPRDGTDGSAHLSLDYTTPPAPAAFASLPPLQAVVWAQGLNASDSILRFEPDTLRTLWQANVGFIAASLAELLRCERLEQGCRLCVVSSIWQLESRMEKFSYTVSKAALQGLVKSCALDLGSRGMLINAVLPGVVDTPMTRRHLSPKQVEGIIDQTALQRLARPSDIAETVAFLVGPGNGAITGQSIPVDGGFVGLRRT